VDILCAFDTAEHACTNVHSYAPMFTVMRKCAHFCTNVHSYAPMFTIMCKCVPMSSVMRLCHTAPSNSLLQSTALATTKQNRSQSHTLNPTISIPSKCCIPHITFQDTMHVHVLTRPNTCAPCTNRLHHTTIEGSHRCTAKISNSQAIFTTIFTTEIH